MWRTYRCLGFRLIGWCENEGKRRSGMYLRVGKHGVHTMERKALEVGIGRPRREEKDK